MQVLVLLALGVLATSATDGPIQGRPTTTEVKPRGSEATDANWVVVGRGDSWLLSTAPDGSGQLFIHYSAPPVFWEFAPGTFDTKGIASAIRPHLSNRSIQTGETIERVWQVSIGPKGWAEPVKWDCELVVVGDCFELARQACRRQPERDSAQVAHQWRIDPPSPLSKVWDAPVDPGTPRGLVIPDREPPPCRAPDGTIVPRVLVKLNYVYWDAQIRADGSAIFGEKLGLSACLRPGTFQVRALIDWLKPQVENLSDGLPGNVQFRGDDGQFRRYYPPSDEIMASLFEMFRYAFKRQQSHYPPVEESWYLRQPTGGSRPWNYPLFWNPLMERLLSPSLRPTADMEAKARQFRDPSFWAATGYWEVIIQPNGAGSVVCRDGDANQEPRPVFEVAKAVFPPGSFKLDAHLPRWRPRLSDTKPIAPWMYAVFALPDPASNDRLVQFRPLGPDEGSGVAPLAEVFELVRQTCRREKPSDLAAIAEHWKKHPPLEHYSTEPTKAWDAPFDEPK